MSGSALAKPSMPLPPRAELHRRILALELPRGAKELHLQLSMWGKQKRLVNPSIATLSKLLRCSPRTVRRHLATLTQHRLITRVYNGGRGKRCVFYVGARAAELAAEAPAWAIPCKRKNRESSSALGELRLGRVALSRKDDKIVMVTPDHSSKIRECLTEIQRAGEGSAGGQAPELSPAVWSDSPPTPPSGGEAGGEVRARAALERPPTDEPPNPPQGGASGQGVRRAQKAGARVWLCEPELWRAVWGLWRGMHLAVRRRHPVPDQLRDPVAMAGLIREALFAARQNRGEALRYLGWGFRQHLRARPDEPLWRLRRVRPEYGHPRSGWVIPTREQLAAAANPAPRPTPPTDSGGPSPSTSTAIERAQAIARMGRRP